jgi:hypothetical protein
MHEDSEWTVLLPDGEEQPADIVDFLAARCDVHLVRRGVLYRFTREPFHDKGMPSWTADTDDCVLVELGSLKPIDQSIWPPQFKSESGTPIDGGFEIPTLTPARRRLLYRRAGQDSNETAPVDLFGLRETIARLLGSLSEPAEIVNEDVS